MKALLQFVFPTIKAIFVVVGFFIGVGWGAYQAVSMIAKAEATAVKEEMKTIRSLDMEHLNKRFDRLENILKQEK